MALFACEAVPVSIPKNEPVLLPVKDPERKDAWLAEKEPVKGPSPLSANDVEVTFTTEVEIANEAVSQLIAFSTEPKSNDAVSANEALPSKSPITLVTVNVSVLGV